MTDLMNRRKQLNKLTDPSNEKKEAPKPMDTVKKQSVGQQVSSTPTVQKQTSVSVTSPNTAQNNKPQPNKVVGQKQQEKKDFVEAVDKLSSNVEESKKHDNDEKVQKNQVGLKKLPLDFYKKKKSFDSESDDETDDETDDDGDDDEEENDGETDLEDKNETNPREEYEREKIKQKNGNKMVIENEELNQKKKNVVKRKKNVVLLDGRPYEVFALSKVAKNIKAGDLRVLFVDSPQYGSAVIFKTLSLSNVGKKSREVILQTEESFDNIAEELDTVLDLLDEKLSKIKDRDVDDEDVYNYIEAMRHIQNMIEGGHSYFKEMFGVFRKIFPPPKKNNKKRKQDGVDDDDSKINKKKKMKLDDKKSCGDDETNINSDELIGSIRKQLLIIENAKHNINKMKIQMLTDDDLMDSKF